MAAPVETLWKSSQLTQTPVRPGVRVPAGHIVVSNKWRGTLLISEIQAALKVHFEDNLGVVDFHPSSDFGVIYVRESDLASGVDYKKKLLKLQKVGIVRGMVIVEKTITTNQYFPELQKFVVLDVGFALIPVANQSEAASFLIQMYFSEFFEFNALDTKASCTPGDIVLIKQLPQKKTTQIWHEVKEIVFKIGSISCPLSGRKVQSVNFIDEMEKLSQIIDPTRIYQAGLKNFNKQQTKEQKNDITKIGTGV